MADNDPGTDPADAVDVPIPDPPPPATPAEAALPTSAGPGRLLQVLNGLPGFVVEGSPPTLRCKTDGWTCLLPVGAEMLNDELADAVEAAAAQHLDAAPGFPLPVGS